MFCVSSFQLTHSAPNKYAALPQARLQVFSYHSTDPHTKQINKLPGFLICRKCVRATKNGHLVHCFLHTCLSFVLLSTTSKFVQQVGRIKEEIISIQRLVY
jgi:hypothetical protein